MRPEKRGRRVNRISLILSALIILVACAGGSLSEPPTEYLYVFDTTHGVCAKYKIVDKNTFKVDPNGEDLPLSSCDGFIAIDRKEFKPLQSWINKAQEYFKDNCK